MSWFRKSGGLAEFVKSEKSTVNPDLFVSATNSGYSGRFAWDADPFFRPTVGVFCGGAMIAAEVTRRRPQRSADGLVRWFCEFEADLDGQNADWRRGALITCLESGDILFNARAETANNGGTRLGVTAGEDWLMSFHAPAERKQDLNGFGRFLTLPAGDQIDLLYRGYLGRGADEGGLKSYLDHLFRANATILDVRDSLVKSDEFLARRLQPFERAGRWIAWSGLNAVDDRVLVADHSALGGMSSIRGLTDDGNGASRLAAIALGREVDGETHRLWVREHGRDIAGLLGAIKNRQRGEAPGAGRQSGLAAEMTPEAAGRALLWGGKVRGVALAPGAEGLVGSLRVPLYESRACRIGVIVNHSCADPKEAVLTLEVLHSAMVVGRREFRSLDLQEPTFFIDLNLSDELASVPDPVLLELRLYATGFSSLTVLDAFVEADDSVDLKESGSVEWLGALSLGQLCSRAEDGGAIHCPSNAENFVAYGPYRPLRPGRYTLRCVCIAETDGRQRAQLGLDVAHSAASVIVGEKTVLLGAGEQTVAFDFEIASQDDGRVPRDVEFRVRKQGSFDLVVRSLTTQRSSDTKVTSQTRRQQAEV